jgi:hypothetical protein
MIVQIRDRAGIPFVLPASLSLRPLRYRTDAQGGHVFATLRADADSLALWRLIGWLRYRVEIHDDLGTPVWWGYIHSVDVSTGGVGVGISLDSMANRVACIWSNDDTGGTTTFAEDTTSTDVYGDKELLISASGVTEAAAEQRRDWELARRKYPSPILSPGLNDIQFAVIECRGWIESTAWTYYERDEGLVEYVPSGGVAQKMGWGFTSSELGFTARGKRVAEASAHFNALEKGEIFVVTGSSSNNFTYTVESSSNREPGTVTATSIAFLQNQRRAFNEYIRATHNAERKLNNFNLFGATTSLSTLAQQSGVTGTHTGSADAAVLTDSGKSWTTDQWVGRRIKNITDGSTGTIKSNTATTITVSLSGGADNDWDNGDAYTISPDEIWLNSVAVIEGQDRIRIELDAGGYHQTFVRGTPNPSTGRVLIADDLPSVASSTNDVDRINRWVTNEGGSTFYTETTDYTIDASDGAITVLSSGSITNNQVLKVSYIYTEYRIEDANLGLAFVSAGDIIKVTGSSSNNSRFRVLSTASDGDRITVRESVTDEGPGASVTIARGGNITVEETVVDELPGASATVYAYGWKVAQSFEIPSDEAWNVFTVEVRARRIGSPVDNLRAAIYSNSSGSPGSSIESATVVGSGISTQPGWVTFTFAGTTALAVGTTYWLVIDRSGSASPTAYYELTVDLDQGYTDGVCKVSSGSTWHNVPTGGDMPFRILGLEATTTQISELVDQGAQFFTGVDILNTSGVSINQYRNGRNTAYDELMDLLEIGTTNDVRLLATVTRDLVLRVEEEPAQPATADYVLTTEGVVRTKLGQALIDGHMDFVGKWVEIPDLPPTADFEYINTPTPFLAESAEYDVERKRYTIQPRGAEPVWRAGMSIDEG